MTITVDVQERRSHVPDALEALGVDVVLTTLPVGDYAVGDRVVERKAVEDLHTSLCGDRFWGQIAALRRDHRRAYVVVEGSDLDSGSVPPRALWGALLKVIDNGIRLVRTSSPGDTALWLHVLARQQLRHLEARTTPISGRRPIVISPVALLSAIPGVSTACAKDLLARYGSVTGVAAASEVDLLTIPGVGRARAKALHQALTQAS